MREILFRGKRIDNGEWVEGMLVRYNPELEVANMADEFEILVPVNTKTVGQYTGLNIGNEKLFEGDIVEWHEDYDDKWGYSQTAVGRSVVIWDKENFCWVFETNAEYIQPFNDWNWNSSYIIGNIHDNPELLKENDNDE